MLSDQEWFRGVYEAYFDRLQKHLYNRAGGNGLHLAVKSRPSATISMRGNK